MNDPEAEQGEPSPGSFESALEATLASVTRPTITLGRGTPPPTRAAPPGDTATEPILAHHAPPASDTPTAVDPQPPPLTVAAPSADDPPFSGGAAPEAVPPPAAAPAASLSMPTLPSAAAAPVPIPGAPAGAAAAGMTPHQMTSHQIAAMQSGAHTSSRPGTRDGHRVARTIMFMVLAAALAAGGRYGLDWYERTEVTEEAVAALGATAELDVGIVDPPELQLVSLESRLAFGDLVVGAASQVNLRDGSLVIDLTMSPPVNGVSAMTIDARGDQVVGRADPAGPWTVIPPEFTVDVEPLRDNFDLPWVVTLSDLVPRESLPFVTVVERTEEVLDHPALVPVRGGADPEPTTIDVRRFVIRRDHDAFRLAEPVAYGQLPRYGRWELEGETFDQLEIWIDDANVVRRLHIVDEDGGTGTFVWIAGSRSSAGFPAPPVIAPQLVVAEGG